MTTSDEYYAMQQAAWEGTEARWLDLTPESQFKRAWERGYQDAVREMRKQVAEQAALIRAAMEESRELDPYPWFSQGWRDRRYRRIPASAISPPAVWAPRPEYEQDINRYPESQYGRRREVDQ